MFNCFNFSFTSATHWKYAHISDKYYSVGFFLSILSLLIIIGTIIYLQTADKREFGEFKNKFKNSWSTELYIPLSLVFRTALAVYIAIQGDYLFSTLVSLFISIVFILYILINLPYSKYYHNYRTAFIHFTYIYIILLADYYRTMKVNTPMNIKVRIFAPSII